VLSNESNQSSEDPQLVHNLNDLTRALEHFHLDESICANIRPLARFNVPIWLDLDSTQLDKHERLRKILSIAYSRISIVFNFPHVHNVKMKLNLNRQLLLDTFQSIEALIDEFPDLRSILKVYISLCHGQSGLNDVEPEDKHRSWPDSWQLTEMADNFILVNVLPFGSDLLGNLIDPNDLGTLEKQYEHNIKSFCSGDESADTSAVGIQSKESSIYKSFGYRLQNRPFNLSSGESEFKGGNVFIFEYRADILQSLNQNW